MAAWTSRRASRRRAQDAAGAVAALTDDRHAGTVYDVTGPRLLTFADAATEIARTAGTPIQYVPISFDEYATALTASGVPEAAAGETVDVFRTILDGRNAELTDDLTRALGRAATDFADYARAAATGSPTARRSPSESGGCSRPLAGSACKIVPALRPHDLWAPTPAERLPQQCRAGPVLREAGAQLLVARQPSGTGAYARRSRARGSEPGP